MIAIAAAKHGSLDVAAVTDGGTATDLYIAKASSLAGAIVCGKVTRILKGGKSGFAQFADKQEGFIANLQGAKTGDFLTLIVKSEKTADKDPELTMDLRLPGRCLIFLPHGKGVQFSKRLPPTQRAKLEKPLRDLANTGKGGWIVRHAAADVSPDVILHEANYLLESARAFDEPVRKPGVLRAAPTPLQQAIANHGLGVKEIVADKAALAWIKAFAPDLAARVKHGASSVDFDEVFDDIRAATIALPPTGWIAFDRTRALTVIDVNGGDETNHLQTNLRAMDAVARHIRLRNIGGMIVVDAIRLADPAQRAKMLERLRQKTANDPSAVEVHGLSRMGLIECTRATRSAAHQDVL